IKVHPDDNVAIVANSGGLPAGTVFDDGLTLVDHVPQGHKVALTDIPEGGIVRRYGEVIGTADRPLAKGCWIDEFSVRLPAPPVLE
ncbi:UxaA family hydrolase, partial [Rhodoplanes serenus]